MTRNANIRLGLGALLVLLAAFPISCRKIHLAQKFSAHDSPIEVGGGSIYVQANVGQQFHEVNDQLYTVTAPSNPGQIYPEWVSNVPEPISMTGGWVIRLSNRDPNSNRDADAVRICSDRNCTGNDFDTANHLIYLVLPRPNSRWSASSNQLLFHDTRCNGESGEDTGDSKCEYLVDVQFESPANNVKYSGSCRELVFLGGHCQIGIGTP